MQKLLSLTKRSLLLIVIYFMMYKHAVAQKMIDLKIDRLLLSTGFNETPQGVWYPYIDEVAKENKVMSIIPPMPHPEHPELKEWLTTIATVANESPGSTILIAHSLGCDNILHYLNAYNGQQKFRC